MPIYEFRCSQCGNIQEILVSSAKSDDQVEMTCSACNGESLERVMSRVSYCMGGSKGAKPTISSKSCGSGNTCSTIDLPGPSE